LTFESCITTHVRTSANLKKDKELSMKKLAIVIPAIVGLMTVAIAPRASAEPQIYPTTDGFDLNIGDCYAHFDNSGNLLQGGSMCDDIQLNEARQAARDYVSR
jgi:hypothetical protein